MLDKDIWIENVFSSLKEIASEEFQLKGWVKGEIHDYCTFVETICGLFNESAFDDFLDSHAKEFGLSDYQMEILNRLRQALRSFMVRYGYYEDPLVIVNDPGWHKIRKLAQEALKSFGIDKYLDPSKKIFKNSLIHAVYEIARPQFQHKIWIKERRLGENPFHDLVKDFLQDKKANEIILNYKEYELTEDQCLILKQLYNLLETYWKRSEKEENLQKILDDPEWHKIQALAKEVLKVFEFKEP